MGNYFISIELHISKRDRDRPSNEFTKEVKLLNGSDDNDTCARHVTTESHEARDNATFGAS